MEKGPDAFRTISEVADDLDLPQHVLRFWESRFPQIHPLKRGGGRRYYRPDDVELLRGIRHLLYGEGYTIRGVQRILKEEGPRYVQAIWRDAEADALAASQHGDAQEWVDAGHPGRIRDNEQEPPQRGGALSGFFNLLPSRQRDVAEEPAAKRPTKRRGADVEPEYMELPLLPDLAPQSRPVRAEPARAEPHIEPVLRPVEARTSFPFRGVSPELSEEDDYEPRYEPEPAAVPPRPMAVPPAAARPEPIQSVRPMPMRPVEDAPVRTVDARANLTRDDVQRLQAALYELQECLGILDAAREQD